MKRWELVIDAKLNGVSNMAKDAEFLEEVGESASQMTIVRFYQWSRPTISLGRNQKIENAVDTDYCALHGIDVVHRPTGGRAVLHDDELTYAVISNDTSCFGDTIYANYKRVSEVLRDAFLRLGVPAILAPETRKPPVPRNGAEPPCFLSPSRYELTVEGRKVVGSAQRRVKNCFLQHGSMPFTCNRETLARATRMAEADSLYREMAGLAEFLAERPSVGEFTDALIESFEQNFDIEFHCE